MQSGARRFPNKSSSSIVLLVLAAFVALIGRGCQGLPSYIANCATIPTPPAITSTVPPPVEPPPQAVCGFPLTVSAPGEGATVTSPTKVSAVATPPDSLYWMRIYVDGTAVYYSFSPTIDQYIWMSDGAHTIEVVAEDDAGLIATSTTNVNVQSQTQGVSGIQNMPGWQSCGAVLATGQTCAAGQGTATSSLTQAQATPALDGSSAQFSISGPHPYSNQLYWYPLGGGNSVSHFTYDLWFYVDNGDAPQSLEFDVNQAFSGTRWTFGTQCDFNQRGKWTVWDPLDGVWVATSIECKHFPSQTWEHLIWNFERVGNQVHYINLSIAGQQYDVDQYFTAQPNWYQEEIDVAFQLDGNYEQEPYNVWLDEVTLNAY